jgi:hypothetical protein
MSINIPTPTPSAPYGIVEDALQLARVRINDAIESIGGEMLTDIQPFTQVMTNAAWRRMQRFLVNLGLSRNRKRVVLTGFPPVGSQDPGSETYLNWSEFFDGVSFWIPPNIVPLPQDFISPLRIGERQSTGFQATLTTSRAGFAPMTLQPDGNYSERKQAWNRSFDWRDDKIVMPGSIYSMDFEIFYNAYQADFNTVGPVMWFNQPIPLIDAEDILSLYIAFEFARPRGDMDAASFKAEAEEECRSFVNTRDIPLRQRTSLQRRSYSGGARGNRGGFGY